MTPGRAARPGRATFADLARAALEKHVNAAREPGVEWTAAPNLAWARWRRDDGTWFYVALRRHLDWMTGEAGLSGAPRALEELPLATPEAQALDPERGVRVRLGEMLHQEDRWWSADGDSRVFHERLEWLALQLAVKAEHWLREHTAG